MNRRARNTGSGGLRSTLGRLGIVAVAALAVGGCDLLLTEPAGSDAVVLDLSPLLSAAPGRAPIEEVVDDITGLRAVLTDRDSGDQLLDETVEIDFSGEVPRAELTVPLLEPSVDVRGEFVLLFQDEPLFAAVETFVLTQGEVTTIVPIPDPEVADVEVAPVPTITALGEVIEIDASALYATGDVIDGATFDYALSDPSILEPVAGQPDRFRAVGEGRVDVTVTASAGAIEFDPTNDSEIVSVEVTPEVVELEADPAALELEVGETAEITVRALDANGNELPRLIVFSSEEPGTASVSSTGAGTADVTGESAGETEIVAAFEDHTVVVPVSVAGAMIPETLEAVPSSVLLEVGQTTEVIVRGRDADGNVVPLPGGVEFAAIDPDVVTVMPTGARRADFTGESLGRTEVVATSGGLSVNIPVDVTPPLGSGDVQVTLTWNTTADLDLWVTDPFGEVIYYANPTSESGGQLDFDDTNGFGPENVFWPEGQAPAGTYRVQVDHFSGASPSTWQVRVITAAGAETYAGTVSTNETADVVTFTLAGRQTPCVDAGGGPSACGPPSRPGVSRPPKDGGEAVRKGGGG